MSPKGEIVNDTGKIDLSNFPRSNKETTGNLKFNLIMKNVTLRETGIYETKIELNDQELQSFKIEVKKVEEVIIMCNAVIVKGSEFIPKIIQSLRN